jgi:hypothetical protein
MVFFDLLSLEGGTTVLSQNVGNGLSSDVSSYPRRTETLPTPLQKKPEVRILYFHY